VATLPKDFTKSVIASVQQELGTLGFEKRKAGILALKVQADVLGTVGLNTATGRGAGVLEINPVVGIRNQQIERLVAELSGDAFDEVIPPTLAGNVGYLSPENRYLPFLFTVDGGVEDIARQLCDAVRMHGLSFIKKMTNLATLVDAMQTVRFGIPFVTEYRIPVGLLLLGDHSKAKGFLTSKLAEIGTRGDPAAVRYKNFAAKLSERLTG
jgi:hypothetical protein